jgi:hypothetical protein
MIGEILSTGRQPLVSSRVSVTLLLAILFLAQITSVYTTTDLEVEVIITRDNRGSITIAMTAEKGKEMPEGPKNPDTVETTTTPYIWTGTDGKHHDPEVEIERILVIIADKQAPKSKLLTNMDSRTPPVAPTVKQIHYSTRTRTDTVEDLHRLVSG